MNPADQAELAACLRLWMKASTVSSTSLYARSLAALKAAAPDPNRAMRAAEPAPCVASNGMPCEFLDLLCEVLPYVRGQRPDLEHRIEAMVRLERSGGKGLRGN